MMTIGLASQEYASKEHQPLTLATNSFPKLRVLCTTPSHISSVFAVPCIDGKDGKGRQIMDAELCLLYITRGTPNFFEAHYFFSSHVKCE
jgi:hypothetical protein